MGWSQEAKLAVRVGGGRAPRLIDSHMLRRHLQGQSGVLAGHLQQPVSPIKPPCCFQPGIS